jgi:hypothetical protein
MSNKEQTQKLSRPLIKEDIIFTRKNSSEIRLTLKEIKSDFYFITQKGSTLVIKDTTKISNSREINIVAKSPKKLTEEEKKHFNLVSYEHKGYDLFFLPFFHYYIVDQDWLHMDRHIGPDGSMKGPDYRLNQLKSKFQLQTQTA